MDAPADLHHCPRYMDFTRFIAKLEVLSLCVIYGPEKAAIHLNSWRRD